MPYYNYHCLDCLRSAKQEYQKNDNPELSIDEVQLPDNLYQNQLYEVRHMLTATKEELDELCKCPKCGGVNYEKSIYGLNVISYTRGYGYLDKKGCTRDMNKYKLVNEDPYAQYRQPGEVDHLKDKLDKAGKHDPKTKFFT